MKNKILFVSTFVLILSFNIYAQTTAQKYASAMNAYKNHNYALANSLFQKFFSGYNITDGLYATAKYYSSDALMNLGDNSAAASGFEFFVNHFPWSRFRDHALYNLGIIYFKQNNYETSRSKFQELLEDYPESMYAGSAMYWIGQAYSRENRLQDAIIFFKDAIAKHPENKYIDYSIFTLASIYEKLGDYKNAVKYYDNLLSYHSGSPLATAAHIRIGVCYFKLKEYDSSIIELNDPLLKELPEEVYSQSIYLLANSYYRLKNYPKAENAYLEIIRKYPASNEVRDAKYGLAWAYFQAGQYEDAYRFFNNLSEGNDSIAVNSFYWKAESKRYAGKETEAFKIYQEFLKKYPNSNLMKGVQYQLGLLYFNSKQYDLAIKYLQSSIENSSNLVRAKSFEVLGEIQLDKKAYNTAKEYFQDALNVPNINADLINHSLLGLGVTYYYLKDYADAISNLSDISFKDPTFEKDKINFYLAESYYSQGKYRDAIQKYNKVNLNDNELAGMALYGKAYCYFNLNEFDSAIKALKDFIKRFPHNDRTLDAKFRLADSYYASKNFAASSRIYQEIMRSNTHALNNPYDYYQYAQALFRANETRQAINEFKILQAKFPKSEYADKSLYVIGWIYFQQGNYNTAISKYRNVLSVYPNSSIGSLIYYSMGDCYYNLANYDSAVFSYQQVLLKYPGSDHIFDAVNGIQDCYVAQGHPERAVKFISQFIKQNPTLSYTDQIFYKKGDIYYSNGNYKDAESSYQEFITTYPNSKLVPKAYYWVGKSAENLKQDDIAITNFNKVFTSYPESEEAPAAVIELGNIYNSKKNYDAAINIYNNALNTLPNKLRFPEIMFNEGMTYINKKDQNEAANVFNQIIQNYNETIFAEKSKLELGLISIAAKQYDVAKPYFQDLAQNRTDEIGAQAQYFYGVSLFDQKDYTDAITAFVRVGTIFPAFDEWVTKSYLKLGDCYIQLKDDAKAKEMYRIVFTKHRGDEYGKEAITKLRKLR